MSVAVQVTVVTPMSNELPEGLSHPTLWTPRLSVAVGAGNVTARLVAPGAASNDRLPGTATRTGGSRSLTVMVNEFEVVRPDVWVAMHVTVVTPIGKRVPETWSHTTLCTPRLSVAVGAVNVTAGRRPGRRSDVEVAGHTDEHGMFLISNPDDERAHGRQPRGIRSGAMHRGVAEGEQTARGHVAANALDGDIVGGGHFEGHHLSGCPGSGSNGDRARHRQHWWDRVDGHDRDRERL